VSVVASMVMVSPSCTSAMGPPTCPRVRVRIGSKVRRRVRSRVRSRDRSRVARVGAGL
jgi:hypothetical protein